MHAQAQPARGANKEPDETWHVQVAAGDVRLVDLDKLDDLFRFEVIDENAFVWKKGMDKWARLGDLLGAEDEPEQPFHVLFSPGNVRVLSLDELNDFYKHEIVDESTLIWQSGMSEWQTLGKAAGIDEAVLPLRDAVSSTIPTQVRPVATQPPARTGASVRAAPQATPIRSSAPAPVTAPQGALLVTPASASAYPAAVVQGPAFSTRPVSLSIEPYPSKPAPAASRWLTRLALVAGAVLAMQRNDIVHAALGQSPLLAQYEQTERALLGGPAFGTTRSVEQLIASCGGHLDPVHLPIAVTQFADAQKRGAVKDVDRAATADATTSPAPPIRDATTGTSPSRVAPIRDATAGTSIVAPASTTKGSLNASTTTSRAVSSALSGKTPAAVSHPSKPRSSSGKHASKSGVKASGSYYDPLNGAL